MKQFLLILTISLALAAGTAHGQTASIKVDNFSQDTLKANKKYKFWITTPPIKCRISFVGKGSGLKKIKDYHIIKTSTQNLTIKISTETTVLLEKTFIVR